MKRQSLIDSISVQWDLWIGKYRAFFPTSTEDIRDCLQLSKEAGTVDGLWGEEDKETLKFQLAACQDTRTGKLIASVHLANASQVKTIQGKEEQYQLGLFDEERLAGLAIFWQLSIHPAHQKSQAAIVLLSHCFIEVLKAGGQAVLMSCDPGHYSIYKRLGMRPIGTLGKTAEGLFRIPMIFVPDYDYLSIIHSPVLPLMRGVNFDAYQPLCQWYYQLVRENSALQAGAAYYPDEEEFESHHAITEGLSEKGREAFLKSAVVIHCREDEVLITENDSGKAFGFVRKGMLRVVIGNKTIVQLGEGDIFGEIAFILHTKRTAQVVAASPDTEVVLFGESALHTLEEDADRAIIWRNLARVLAQRVLVTNKLLG